MDMRKQIIFYCLCLLLGTVSAQDPHFSQFFSSPLTLNPAFTGKFFGTYRVAGNYRNQWPAIDNAFTTATASIDFHILQNKIASNDTWGVGFVGYNDNSSNGAVKFNYASVSTAYHKGLDEEGLQQLGAGFQVTYANMLINTNQLKFEDQLTSSGFTGVSSEVFNTSTLKSSYVDVNAGILYNGSTTDRNNFYFGVSMYHINRPRQDFTGAAYARIGTSDAFARLGLRNTQMGSMGKITSTVAISPLLVFSLVKKSGWPLVSAASPQAATHSR